MSPASRASLAASLATEVSASVAPPPPPGTGPEEYLAAVLVERRQRELARLTRARARSTSVGERLNRLPYSRETL
jgi:hypothetical protein